jgi:ATP/maltotriose-dependent transcriptional regulator MalT
MQSSIIITRTKLLVPKRRDELVSRPRLLEMLNELLDYKLIIVAAPAGYGKTSLLIDFVHQYQWPVCWFALDTLDQDPQRFMAHFVTAIQYLFPTFGQFSLQTLQNMSPEDLNIDFMVTTLANDIFEHISEHFIFVLDDYHLLKDNKKIDQFLSEFLQKSDENCHVVITSRTLLTLPDLPLLVARSQVGGLSVEELAFLPEEICALYRQNFKQEISLQEGTNLATQSEGWITGLLLTSEMDRSGLRGRTQVARASGVGLYEYLAQQVLGQQPQELQLFLLQSSLLEEFDANMCMEVVGNALNQKQDWTQLMNTAVHNNAFVLPVGDERLYLRYHHLFRDFLQERMRRDFPRDSEKISFELANYYRLREDWDRVFLIYHQLERWQDLAQLLNQIGSDFIAKGRVNKLSDWLDSLLASLIKDDPGLLSLRASVAVNKGNIQEGLNIFNQVVEKLTIHTNKSTLADTLVRRSTARRMLGDYAGAAQDAEEALGYCARNKNLTLLKAEALRAKGSNLYQQAILRDSLRWLEQSLQIYQQHNREQDVARILVEIGAVHDGLGEFAAAEEAYKKSLTYWQLIGDSIWQANVLNNLGVLQHSIGDFENSFNNLEKAMHYARICGNLRMEGYSLASIGDLYRDLEAYPEAQDAYQKAIEIAQQVEEQFLIFYIKLAQGRVQIDQGHLSQADLLIKSAHNMAKKTGSAYELNKWRLESGLLDIINQQFSTAVEHLGNAFHFFREADRQEEVSRSVILLCAAYFMCGDLKACEKMLRDTVKRMQQSQGRISLICSFHEVKPFLDLMQGKDEVKELAAQFIHQVKKNQKHVLQSRKLIRKLATVVPFAPPRMYIRAFGKIEVISHNRKLTNADWITQSSRNLFFLFLAHPEGMTKEEVGVHFWPDASPHELQLRFKNNIYRLRHALGAETLIFRDNYYLFNRSLDFEYDVQTFLQNLNNADSEKNIEKQLAFLSYAIESYTGPYLPGIDEDWARNERQKYFDLFHRALLRLADLYLKKEQPAMALEVGLRSPGEYG